MAGEGTLIDWKVVRELGSGGQGRVSLVMRSGDPIERIIEPLGGLVSGTGTPAQLEDRRRRLGDAFLDFVNGKDGPRCAQTID